MAHYHETDSIQCEDSWFLKQIRALLRSIQVILFMKMILLVFQMMKTPGDYHDKRFPKVYSTQLFGIHFRMSKDVFKLSLMMIV